MHPGDVDAASHSHQPEESGHALLMLRTAPNLG